MYGVKLLGDLLDVWKTQFFEGQGTMQWGIV
jgi:hypothetical protein